MQKRRSKTFENILWKQRVGFGRENEGDKWYTTRRKNTPLFETKNYNYRVFVCIHRVHVFVFFRHLSPFFSLLSGQCTILSRKIIFKMYSDDLSDTLFSRWWKMQSIISRSGSCGSGDGDYYLSKKWCARIRRASNNAWDFDVSPWHFRRCAMDTFNVKQGELRHFFVLKC